MDSVFQTTMKFRFFYSNLPLTTVVNQATEHLRRENKQRKVISPVIATHASIAEKGVASDKEHRRTLAQVCVGVNLIYLQKEAKKNGTHHTGKRGRENQPNKKQADDNINNNHDNSVKNETNGDVQKSRPNGSTDINTNLHRVNGDLRDPLATSQKALLLQSKVLALNNINIQGNTLLHVQSTNLSGNYGRKLPAPIKPIFQQSIEVQQRAKVIALLYEEIAIGVTKPRFYHVELIA